MESDKSAWRNLFHMAQEFKEKSGTIYHELLEGGTRYIDPEFIARGGMKEVYSVKDNTTGRLVALTVLINEEAPESRENFLREARMTAFLQHPNIMPVYDLGIDDGGTPYFTMKLNRGESLSTLVTELQNKRVQYQESYSIQALMQIFRKICEAVAYAHSKGVIHLDIKPDNVQISNYGEVLLCDWGLGKITNRDIDAEESLIDMDALDSSEIHTMTRNDRIKGTPGFMAPEQVKVKNSVRDERTDIYSLGALLYSLLTYEIPIDGRNTTDQLRRTVRGKIIAPRKRNKKVNIPASLEAVCLKAMARLPENRYQDVEEMIDEVDSWQSGFATEAEEAGLIKQLLLIYKRNKLFFVSLLMFALVFVGLLAGFIVIQGNLLKQVAEKEQVAKRALMNLQDERDNKEQLLLDKQLTRLKAAIAVNNSSLIHEAALAVQDIDMDNRKARDGFALYYLLKADVDQFFIYSEDALDERILKYRSQLFTLYNKMKADKQNELSYAIEMMIRLKQSGFTRAGNAFGQALLAKFHTDKGRGIFFKTLLLSINIVKADFKVSYKTTEEGPVLDLSGNKELKRISLLSPFQIYHLDISSTSVSDISSLVTMNLKVLAINNLQLTSYKPLKNMRLKKLFADNSNFKELNNLRVYDLQVLSIRNCPIRGGLRPLSKLKALTRLYIDEERHHLLGKKMRALADEN
jgi:serine/threonine protein kinase